MEYIVLIILVQILLFVLGSKLTGRDEVILYLAGILCKGIAVLVGILTMIAVIFIGNFFYESTHGEKIASKISDDGKYSITLYSVDGFPGPTSHKVVLKKRGLFSSTILEVKDFKGDKNNWNVKWFEDHAEITVQSVEKIYSYSLGYDCRTKMDEKCVEQPSTENAVFDDKEERTCEVVFDSIGRIYQDDEYTDSEDYKVYKEQLKAIHNFLLEHEEICTKYKCRVGKSIAYHITDKGEPFASVSTEQYVIENINYVDESRLILIDNESGKIKYAFASTRYGLNSDRFKCSSNIHVYFTVDTETLEVEVCE